MGWQAGGDALESGMGIAALTGPGKVATLPGLRLLLAPILGVVP